MNSNTTLHNYKKNLFSITVICVFLLSGILATDALSNDRDWDAKVPPSVVDALTAGQEQDLLVLFDDTEIQDEAARMRRDKGVAHDTPDILSFKSSRYNTLKQRVLDTLPYGEVEVLQDYSHLPTMFLRIRSLNSLIQFLERSEIVRVYINGRYTHFLTESLPLINQPQAAASGRVGTGTTVAVLDTGVIYTRSAFGTCSGASTPGYCTDENPPAAPPGCKVACVRDFTPTDDGLLDEWDNGYHGTNVSGIVLGVAPNTRIAALDVFRTDGYAYYSDLEAAINWCIANKSAYNIQSINMSLGGGGYTSPCSGDYLATSITNARSAGILSAIASGNDDYTNMISSPACVPTAVSVGAVYDANVGWISWGSCTDSTTYADKVTCFSNSASYLTILAPGALITAAGEIDFGGTSMAAPHIAGATAVLKGTGAFPSDTVDQTVSRMTTTGVPVYDSRNGITKPRIDVFAALGGGVTYSVSGTVRTSGGSPIAGVTITLGGAGSGTTTTDGSGNYSFSGLSDGSYTVTPGMSGYAFTPTSRSVSISGADVTGQDFTGTPVPTYALSGTVQTSGGSPLPGVTMALGGAGSGTTTTDGSGNYSFSGLPDGSYTVTPNLNGYAFTPTSRSANISGADVTGQDFIGTPTATYSISGTVATRGRGRRPGEPIAGVTMTLSGIASATTTTDGSGNYSFTGLGNGTYTVTPGLNGYEFNPTSITASVSGANVTGQNFTGTATSVTYSISGAVRTSGGSPIPGVTMTLGGTSSATTTTDGSAWPTHLSTASTALMAASRTPVWPTMSGLA